MAQIILVPFWIFIVAVESSAFHMQGALNHEFNLNGPIGQMLPFSEVQKLEGSIDIGKENDPREFTPEKLEAPVLHDVNSELPSKDLDLSEHKDLSDDLHKSKEDIESPLRTNNAPEVIVENPKVIHSPEHNKFGYLIVFPDKDNEVGLFHEPELNDDLPSRYGSHDCSSALGTSCSLPNAVSPVEIHKPEDSGNIVLVPANGDLVPQSVLANRPNLVRVPLQNNFIVTPNQVNYVPQNQVLVPINVPSQAYVPLQTVSIGQTVYALVTAPNTGVYNLPNNVYNVPNSVYYVNSAVPNYQVPVYNVPLPNESQSQVGHVNFPHNRF